MRLPLVGYLLLAGISVLLLRKLDLEDEQLVLDDRSLNLTFFDLKDPEAFGKKIFHFVPHTHTDPGWLLTMSEYNNISVDKILTTSVDYLLRVRANPQSSVIRRFTFDNIAFLREWVNNNPTRVADMQLLVKEGFIQIINGGVSQHDQGCVYIDHLIFNYEHGREYSKRYFDFTPIIGWSVDPFGVGYGSGKAFKEMGFEFLGLNRLPFEIKHELRINKDLLFNWKIKDSVPENDLLTFVVPVHYGTPGPFNFHSKVPVHYGANPPQTSILSPDFQILSQLCDFMRDLFDQAKLFKEVNVLMLLGDDFAYTDFAREADVLSEIVLSYASNNITGVFADSMVIISTLDQYLNAIKSENSNFTRYELTEGFPLISYETSEGEYGWTGYYTTNPFLKLKIRQLMDLFKGLTNYMSGLALTNPAYRQHLNQTRADFEQVSFTLGVLSHHDAITGTCTRHVIKDYLKMVKDTQQKLNNMLDSLAGAGETHFQASLDSALNVRKNGSTFELLNPSISQPSDDWVKVKFHPDQVTHVSIYPSDSGAPLESLYKVCDVVAGCEEAFKLRTNISRLGSQSFTYAVANQLNKSHNYTAQNLQSYSASQFLVELTSYETGYKTAKGLVYGSSALRIEHIGKDTPFAVIITVGRHEGFMPNKLKKKSGAYVFTTIDGQDMTPFQLKNMQITHYPRTLVISAELRHRPKAFLHVILDDANPHKIRAKIHMETLYFDEEADYVVRYELAIKPETHRPFVVDSSGFEYLSHWFKGEKRLDLSYYPISKFIQIAEPQQAVQLTVLVDRAQGGTSPRPGSIEIAINRVNYGEDNLGLIQRVHDDYSMKTEHLLIIEKPNGVRFRKEQVRSDSQLIYLENSTGDRLLPKVDLSLPNQEVVISEFVRVQIEQKSPGSFCLRIFNFGPQEALVFTKNSTLGKIVQHWLGLSTTPILEPRSLDFNVGVGEYRTIPYKWTDSSKLPEWLASPEGDYSIPPNTIRTFLMLI